MEIEKEIADIKQRLATVEQKVQNQCEKCTYVTGDLAAKVQETKDIVESMRELTISITQQTEQIRHISQEVSDMKVQVAAISNKPAEKWDKVTGTIITALTSGLITIAINLLLNLG